MSTLNSDNKVATAQATRAQPYQGSPGTINAITPPKKP